MKKFILFSALGLFSFNSDAGMVATTVHSRANCYNNESITWWLNHSFDWRVVSTHGNIYGPSKDHMIDTGYAVTWRQAAVHWGEAPIGDHRWFVSGYHNLSDYGHGKFPFDTTHASDCGLDSGWWDH